MVLRLDLQPDHLEWFPARLRHILDNLFAHTLHHRDPASESWVSVELRPVNGRYELRLTDNGVGPPASGDRRVHNLFYPAAWNRDAELGAGLSVVRRLVEHSGGTFATGTDRDAGSQFTLTLPRYDLLDYLE